MRLPKRAALFGTRYLELDDEVEAPRECRVESCLAVAGQQRDSVERLDALQQVVGLRVCEPVVGFLDFGSPSEERVGLVEQEDHFGLLGSCEKLCEISFGLAD